MNSMQTKGITFNAVEELRDSPEMRAAVGAAEQRYETLVEKYNLYESEREFMCATDGPNGPHVILIAIERDDYGHRTAQRQITRKHMLDPVARNAAVSDLFMDILSKRLKQANAHIAAELRELEDTEVSNGARR